ETIFSMGGYTIAAAFADAEDSWFGDTIEASYYVSKEMKNLYGQDDLRASRYIGETEIWNYPDAFRKVSGQRSKYGSYCEVSSSFLMRTPEAYLNYAEAMAYAGNESAARQKLVTFLHTRMTADVNLDALSGNDLIDFIRDERAREFLLEGHRWFDLRRYTVCQPYPWSKTISHDYAFYGDYDLAYIERYVLEKFDAAYTLPIPRSVRNFQASIGNNPRPERTPNRVEPETDDDDDYDDWDW
ncbi:MAG: RagB/SusD family nutrient uptake outer membrane protein, partial [Duncaniella sp.]|nr:RagB/SusD family nutrient uptake outer membrane protein [Duncaniella sp.]